MLPGACKHEPVDPGLAMLRLGRQGKNYGLDYVSKRNPLLESVEKALRTEADGCRCGKPPFAQ
jgi:hypothetical protein